MFSQVLFNADFRRRRPRPEFTDRYRIVMMPTRSILFAGGLFSAAIFVACTSNGTRDSGTTAARPRSTEIDQHVNFPSDEREFITTVSAFRTRYQQAQNEFKKSALRKERSQAIAMILPKLSIRDWIGDISSMQTTKDERGILAVKLGNGSISVQTVNNVLSDALVPGTLIPHASPLYEQVANLAVGNTVTFSGRFTFGGLDYAREESVTEEGSMTDPEFIFTFTNVRLGVLSQRSENADSKPSVAEPASQPVETTPTVPIATPAPELTQSGKTATPTSGVLCNGAVNVPQSGQLVFENLPGDRLHFTFDHDAWRPTIRRQPNGTQTLVMRSLKPGIQTGCDIRWETMP